MKKENNIEVLYFLVALSPSLLVAIIYFFLSAKTAVSNEALEDGFIIALWFYGLVGSARFIFDEEISLRSVSLFPMSVTGLAIVSLIMGFGNPIALIIIACLGLALSFLAAYKLRDPSKGAWGEYIFAFAAIASSTLTNFLSALALGDKLNILDWISKLI